MKAKSESILSLAFAGAILCGMSAAHGATTIESFESGTLNGWGGGTLNGVTTSVNADRASDGTQSAGVVFTVGDGNYGWSPRTILGIYAPDALDADSTTISVDIYRDWANPEGWGLWANDFKVIINNNSALVDGGWHMIDPSSVVDLVDGWKTYTFNLAPYVPGALDPASGWSALDIVWFTGGGPDGFVGTNGVQTISVDNIQIVPECGTFALLGLGAMGGLAIRRRVTY